MNATNTELTLKERNRAKLLLNQIRQLREALGMVPLQRAEALLEVALDNGSSLGEELAEKLDISPAAMSRHLRDLSKIGVKREKGPDLVVTREDPYSARRKLSRLTPKGRRLVKRILLGEE